jgi:hypothetical protein
MGEREPKFARRPDRRRYYTGDTINPLCELVDAAGAPLANASVHLRITPPKGAAPVEVELFDDGVHDDGARDPDGIYGRPLPDVLQQEGAYVFAARARWAEDGASELTFAVDVRLGIDPGSSAVSAAKIGPDQVALTFAPADRYRTPLGPGRLGELEIWAAPGSAFLEEPLDLGDGRYRVTLAHAPQPGRPPGIVIGQRGRHAVTLAAPLPPARPARTLPRLRALVLPAVVAAAAALALLR